MPTCPPPKRTPPKKKSRLSPRRVSPSQLPSVRPQTLSVSADPNPHPYSYIETYYPKSAWPYEVPVLDSESLVHGPIYSLPVNGEPCSINAWVDHPFRRQHNINLSMIQTAISVWWSIHHYFIRSPVSKGVEPYQIYNTIWAYLGYTEDQDPEAIQLALSFRNKGGPTLPKLMKEIYAEENARDRPPPKRRRKAR